MLARKCVFIFGLILVGFSACQKEESGMDSGTITGYDFRKCMCCGGWFVEIGDSTWRFDQLPEGSTLELDPFDMPVAVWLSWEKKDPQCLGDEIVVDQITKRE